MASASGNDIPSYFATLYAAHIEKAGGVTKFFSGPSASGGGLLNGYYYSIKTCLLLVFIVLK